MTRGPLGRCRAAAATEASEDCEESTPRRTPTGLSGFLIEHHRAADATPCTWILRPDKDSWNAPKTAQTLPHDVPTFATLSDSLAACRDAGTCYLSNWAPAHIEAELLHAVPALIAPGPFRHDGGAPRATFQLTRRP